MATNKTASAKASVKEELKKAEQKATAAKEVIKEESKKAATKAQAKTEDAKKVVKETAKKASASAEKTTKAVKETAKKAEKETKKVASKAKTAAKKTAEKIVTKEVYFEFADKQFNTSEITEMVENAYVSEGNKKTAIKSIKLYVKAEDSAVYYVINDKEAGKISL